MNSHSGSKRSVSGASTLRTTIIEPLESRVAPAGVSILTVTSLADNGGSGTLRSAINKADTAGTPYMINFHLKGTITLSPTLGPLSITDGLTMAGSRITINGAGKTQDISITGGNVTLDGLKITNGHAPVGAGLYINDPSGTVTLEGCVITGNHAAGSMIPGASGGYAHGGGIANLGGSLAIESLQTKTGTHTTTTKSQITRNSAAGGAGALGNSSGGGTGYNGGDAAGGGIYNAASLTITSAVITGNTATGGAGGLGANATYSKSASAGTAGTYGGNGGHAYGGGIYNTGPLSITKARITGNSAAGGKGGSGGNALYANANTYGGGVGGNGGAAGGGGIFNSGGAVTIQSSTLSGNTAKAGSGSGGGTTFNGANGSNFSVTTYQGTQTPNPAAPGANGGNGYAGGNGGNAVGGAISSTTGSVTITASTLSGNLAAPGNGGNGTAGGNGGKGGNGGHYAGTPYYGYAGGNGGSGGDAGTPGIAKGGGIYSTDSLIVKTSTISGNILKTASAGTAGGGGAKGANGTLYNGTGGATAGAKGALASASASYGGGIYSGGGTIAISLATIAKNTAQAGGGIDISMDTAATIHNSTIALNTGTTAGGLAITLDAGNDPVNIVSTIIAQNLGAANITGTPGAGSSNNITTGLAVKTSLGFHDHGATQTLLPLASLASVPNNTTTNPDALTTDQNGTLFLSSIKIGAVQKTT